MNPSHLKRPLRSPLTEILAFILIISFLWNHTTVDSGEFSSAQVLLIFGYITVVIFLQIVLTCCVYYALRGKSYRQNLTAVTSGAFLAVNLLLLLLIHYEPFARLAPIYKYSYFAAFIFYFYALIYAMFGSVLIRRGALSAATLLLSYSVATSALGTQIVSTEEASLGEFTPVKFERKPNIYFMGLDALSPETIAKRHLKVEKVSYAEALRTNDFRIFKNAFADRVGTKYFYNSLLGQSFSELETDEERRFFVFDRHAISLSVWPKVTCKTSFDREAAKGYITMSQMARALVRCLAGGVDPLPANSRYRLPYEDARYEDYKYE